MSTDMANAEELIAITSRLAALIEDEVAVLKTRRPVQLARNESDRTTTMLLYTKAATAFKTSGANKKISTSARDRLKTVTARLNKAMKEHTSHLLRFRYVTEGLIKAVADVVIARETPSVYGKSGTVRTPQANRPAVAMTLNQAI